MSLPKSILKNEHKAQYPFAVEMLGKYCSDAKTLLNVGAGHQYWSVGFNNILRSAGYEVVPTDINPRAVGVIKDDITSSKLCDNSYDVILCIGVMAHVADYHKAFFEMVRLLKKGGVLIMCLKYNIDECCENVYKTKESHPDYKNVKYGCRAINYDQLYSMIDIKNLDILETRYWRAWTGEFWAQGKPINENLSPEVCKPGEAQILGVVLRK